MSSLAVGTVFAKNYLSRARVVADSFRSYHPEIPFFALLSDEPDACLTEDEPFRLLYLDQLKVASLHRLRFLYSCEQLATALKPHLLSYLLDRGFNAAIFLDPDVLVLNPLNDIFKVVRSHALTLVPHLVGPPAARDGIARELNVLLSGVYNGGLVGVSEAPSARCFLNWWQERLRDHSCHAVCDGMYFDQRWLDLAVVFFEDVCIYRDPGCNVAYWNLPERTVRIDPSGAVSVNGVSCRLFHFSGYNPDQPNSVTNHFPSLTLDNVGEAATVFRRYLALLIAAGYQSTKSLPYAYDYFSNGVPVTDIARRLYRELGADAERFGDPLDTSVPDSFFDWLRETDAA